MAPRKKKEKKNLRKFFPARKTGDCDDSAELKPSQ
jgi:hypothetical protein